MKKIFFTLIALSIILIIGYTFAAVSDTANQETIASKLIRFHVIANSDTGVDQALKLKVRDKVLEFISPKLEKSQSIEESRKILLQNNEEIKRVAQKVVAQNGYEFNVQAKLSNENFPVKTYGNITLPQGKYEAYRIIIGEGAGRNWWCVMFPPLCFVDITKGNLSYDETEKRMKKVLTKEEYKIINNLKYEEIEEKPVEVKFKIVEIFKKIFK